MRCESIMSKKLYTLAETNSTLDAARLMRDYDVGFIPITNSQGKVVGTLTDRDIVVRLAAGNGSLTAPIRQHMTSDVVSCKASDDITRAENLMRQRRKSRIVCVDDQGQPVGVVSLSDIAQHEDAANVGQTLREITRREAHQA